jgi:hypothetical protein
MLTFMEALETPESRGILRTQRIASQNALVEASLCLW